MKIGIICPSNIAMSRFLPALRRLPDFEFAGIGVCGRSEVEGAAGMSDAEIDHIIAGQQAKALEVTSEYGGVIYHSYEETALSPDIEALYIPLPPALHYRWAKIALLHGKHVMVEKPSTIAYKDSRELVDIAERNHLALHENYMFVFHRQIDEIAELIQSGRIGEVRLYRISFGFPRRSTGDFRYQKSLGGGALLDAGGYTIRYACSLLGNSARLVYAKMNYTPEFDADLYGSGALVNDEGVTAQISFGMDNSYKCELEVWGSKGTLVTNRVLTAPAGYVPSAVIHDADGDQMIEFSADDTFVKSIEYFAQCTVSHEERSASYSSILNQSRMIDDFRTLAQQDAGNI